MDTGKSHEELVHYIQSQGKAAYDGRQLVKRLRKLLPSRLKEIKDSWRKSYSSGKAERRALVDQRFLDHISEMVDVLEEANERRVTYETYGMLLKARQSLRRKGGPFRRRSGRAR